MTPFLRFFGITVGTCVVLSIVYGGGMWGWKKWQINRMSQPPTPIQSQLDFAYVTLIQQYSLHQTVLKAASQPQTQQRDKDLLFEKLKKLSTEGLQHLTSLPQEKSGAVSWWNAGRRKQQHAWLEKYRQLLEQTQREAENATVSAQLSEPELLQSYSRIR